MHKLKLFLLFIILNFASSPILANAKLSIVASIKPYYNLAAAITDGAAEPKLLVKGFNSPHDYMLSPSDVMLIQQADVIVWGGAVLEPYLEKLLADNKKPQVSIDVSKVNNIVLYPIREHDHEHDHQHSPHATELYDPHLWLSPANAKLIAAAVTKQLMKSDPNNQNRYKANQQEFLQKLATIDAKIWQLLAPYKQHQYFVFHDAYQYFEKYYALTTAGVIQPDPTSPLAAKSMLALQQKLSSNANNCVFTEPQFDPKVVSNLRQQYKIYSSKIDPLGNDKDLGKAGYCNLLEQLATNLAAGLKKCDATNNIAP